MRAGALVLMCAQVSADDWKTSCSARLESARKEIPEFAGAKVAVDKDAVRLQLTAGPAAYAVLITPTSPSSSARNSWNPPRDTWVDLPIIDKSYSTTKLNRFRWSSRLEGTLTASRGDDSPRSPPVPEWLQRFVDVFGRAVEDCLK